MDEKFRPCNLPDSTIIHQIKKCSKLNLIIILFITGFCTNANAIGERFVLWESADNIAPPLIPVGWTVENANGDNYIFQTVEYGGLPESHQCFRYAGNPTSPADDWLFSPELKLDRGIQYTLSFRIKSSTNSISEKLNVWIGSQPSSSSMTTMLIDKDNITNKTMKLVVLNISVQTSGSYYLGFHCYSLPNQKHLFLDDIKLAMPSTEFEISFAFTKQLLNRTSSPPTYNKTDTIDGYLFLTNVSNNSIVVNKSLNVGDSYEYGTGLTYIVTNPDGDTLYFALKAEPEPWSTVKSYTMVAPGNFIGRLEDLQKLFTFTKSGTYKMTVIYRNYHQSQNNDSWLGKVISEPVTFTVK
jgi:hypothetical protein